MNTSITPEIREVMEAIHYRPAISIVMPFEPKMRTKTELAYSLQMAVDKVEQQLVENYPDEIVMLVMQKLRALIKGLNFSTYKKSIAVYVSPVFEKLLYLDIAVEEKVIVDESFEIRDLVYCKKQMHKYLVLLLSGSEVRIFLGNADSFVRILSNTPGSVSACMNDVAESVANFSDLSARKEIMMHKLLHHIDNSLNIILHAYPLPLFVLGNERILGHFRKITKHKGSVTEFIEGNYENATIPEIARKLEPFIADWKKVIQKDLLNQLEEAAGKNKLAVGMREVWREAMRQKGRLLLVEKNYMYAAERGSTDEIIYKAIEPYNRFSYIKDAVDDVIEKVLENGGDVEFVDTDFLKDYHHIALLQYY
jgi:hypothetical protein